MKKGFFVLPALLLFSCMTTRQAAHYTRMHSALADSMLAKALDYEAVYSLLDTLKPISSILTIKMDPAAAPVSTDTIILYQQLCQELSTRQVQLVAIPFRQAYEDKKLVELYAVNLHRYRSRINEYGAFFAKLGITSETPPVQTISIVENADKYDRWRAYGYLFGYPGYAVDFFVQAGMTQDSTGEFVKRDFFQIPVQAGIQGHFTYAMPKGYTPGIADSTLYYKALHTLQSYQQLREKYITSQGMRARQLWADWYKSR